MDIRGNSSIRDKKDHTRFAGETLGLPRWRGGGRGVGGELRRARAFYNLCGQIRNIKTPRFQKRGVAIMARRQRITSSYTNHSHTYH